MKLYVIVYSHRHGVDAWPEFCEVKPSSEDIIKSLKRDGSYDEKDANDISTYVEVRGPFDRNTGRLTS